MPTVNNRGHFLFGLGFRLESRRVNEARQRLSCCRASSVCIGYSFFRSAATDSRRAISLLDS
jgi:hypothetical protein